MAERWRRAGVRAATGLASLALLMAVAAVALSLENARRQAEVAHRQVFIDQSQTLARVNGALITALADAAIHQHDTDVQSLLASVGITASLRTASAATATDPPPATTAAPAATSGHP
ncbi:MAG: hypothetical protein ACREFJ_10795 [Acetobacteraceae bacterium]